MKLEKLSLSLKEVIDLSLDEIKTLPDKKRCGLLAMEIDEEFVPGARVILVLTEKNSQLSNLPKQYMVDQKAQFIVAEIPFETIKELSDDSKVKHINKPDPLYPDLDEALFWSGADEVISENLQTQNLNSQLDGEGVLIGLLDSGINYLHPDFSYEVDGVLETNIEGIWLPGGTEWTREDINLAINSENPQDIVPHLDLSGHGTLVAACAASTGRGSGYKGVAPKAGILMAASSSGNLETAEESNSYILAIQWFEQKAAELNKPIVINISKGSNDGPRDGSLPFEGYLDAVIEANNNLVICKTAGNHGDKKHHATGNVKVDEENNTQATLEVTTSTRSFGLDIWYEAEDSFTIQLINPAGLATDLIQEIPVNLDTLDFKDENGVPDDIVNINVTYVPEDQTINGAKHFKFLLNIPDNLPEIPQGQYQVRIRPSSNESAPNGNYHCWLDWTRFSTSNPIEFLPPHQTNSYTLNAGASGLNTIIVGNWEDYSGEIYATSSLGPTRDGRNGVSVVAPGNEIIGAAHNKVLEYTRDPFIQIRTGTSFACPIVSGIVALMYQEALLLNPTEELPSFTEIRQRIMDAAWQDGFTGNTPNPNTGGGKLNGQATINSETPIVANSLVVISEPKVAVSGFLTTIIVKVIDPFHRIVSDASDTVLIEISNSDRANIVIEDVTVSLENGEARISLENPLPIGRFTVNARFSNSQVSGSTVLDIHEAANAPVYGGSGLLPLGRAGNANSQRYQYLFSNRLDFTGFLSRIAWPNSESSSTTTSGWLDTKIIYGIYDGEIVDFSDNLEGNLNRVSNAHEVELGNYTVKDIQPNHLIHFDVNSNTRFDLNQTLFFIELQFFQALQSTNTPSSRSDTIISLSATEIRNNFGANPTSQLFTASPHEPLLLKKNRFLFADVWLRSTENDTGVINIPIGELGASPDIIVRHDESILKPEVKDHQEPRVNLDNFVYIRVRNRGGFDAENVRVSIYWTPLNGGLLTGSLIPENFSYTDEQGREVERNFQIVPLIPANEDNSNQVAFRQVKFKWKVDQVELPDRNESQYALVVILEHPDDRPRFVNGGFEAHSQDNNLSFRRVEMNFDALTFVQRILALIRALIQWILSRLGF